MAWTDLSAEIAAEFEGLETGGDTLPPHLLAGDGLVCEICGARYWARYHLCRYCPDCADTRRREALQLAPGERLEGSTRRPRHVPPPPRLAPGRRFAGGYIIRPRTQALA